MIDSHLDEANPTLICKTRAKQCLRTSIQTLLGEIVEQWLAVIPDVGVETDLGTLGDNIWGNAELQRVWEVEGGDIPSAGLSEGVRPSQPAAQPLGLGDPANSHAKGKEIERVPASISDQAMVPIAGHFPLTIEGMVEQRSPLLSLTDGRQRHVPSTLQDGLSSELTPIVPR